MIIQWLIKILLETKCSIPYYVAILETEFCDHASNTRKINKAITEISLCIVMWPKNRLLQAKKNNFIGP